jgi:hypothetical protein
MEAFERKASEVLQETEKETHQYKDSIFKRTPERKRHYYSLAHGWESNASRWKNAALSKKVIVR